MEAHAMTALCCPTVEQSTKGAGWQRYSRKGVSETVSQPLAVMSQFPSRSISQPTHRRIVQDLAAEPWFRCVSDRLRR